MNAPSSIVEIKEQQVNKTSEVIIFNENEVELGFKHKKNVKEYVKAIIDKQVRIEIIASIPKNNLKDSLNLSAIILNNREFKKINILDLRQNGKVITYEK